MNDETIMKVIKDVRSVVSHILSSGSRINRLKSLSEQSIDKKDLVLDIDIRWWSTSKMLRRAMEFQKEFTILVPILVEEEVKHKRTPKFGMICEDSWDKVNIISDFLDYFEEGSKILMKNSFMSVGRQGVIYDSLIQQCEKEILKYSNDLWIQSGLIACRKCLGKYYSAGSLVNIAAMYLDPRYKSVSFLSKGYILDAEENTKK